MTRNMRRRGIAAAALLVAVWPALDATAAERSAPSACSPEILGTWQQTSSSELEPILLEFSKDGWANVLAVLGERRPQDFDILAQVRYEPAPRRNPRRIEFTARPGNDLFPAGASRWDIVAFTDESLSTRRADDAAGEVSQWSRVQTQRYFLTFAARGGTDSAAFVMWTTLDGRKTHREALGATISPTASTAKPRFGRIPQALVEAFARQSKRADDVMMRIELSEADYRRTHRVFEAWDSLLSGDLLGAGDAQAQALELVQATLQSLNACGARLRLAEGEQSANNVSAGELVRHLRKSNDRRHVTDKLFPWRWQPAPLSAPGQSS